MTILLYNYKNETELLIYEFVLNDIFGKFEFSYVGFNISRRNDKNDVWGHQWMDHFFHQKYKEQNEYEEVNDYYPDNWDYDPLEEGYHAISEKYNPVIQKTHTGESYLTGIRCRMSGSLPTPEFTEEELLEKLKIAVAEKFKDVTVVL